MRTQGPFSIVRPVRSGGLLGSSADVGIQAENDGEPAIIGELWVHGVGMHGQRVCLSPTETARFIVRACNANDEVVEALEDARDRLAKVARIANCGTDLTPEQQQEIYNTAYYGNQDRALAQAKREDS